MPQIQSAFDVAGHQRQQEDLARAAREFLEVAGDIKGINAELSRQNNQLREQTDQLKTHNLSFEKLTAQMARESRERKKSDMSNRWFSVGMAFLSFLLGLLAAHITEIIEWAKSL